MSDKIILYFELTMKLPSITSDDLTVAALNFEVIIVLIKLF